MLATRQPEASGLLAGLFRATLSLTAFLATGTAAAVLAQDPGQSALELRQFEFHQTEMGVDFEIRVYACDFEAANNAAKAAFARIRQLNDVFSDYSAESEIRKLCDAASPGQPVPISEDVRLVLAASLQYSQQTDGAFDVTVGPLTKLWRRARRRGELPEADLLAEARATVGYQQLRLDSAARTLEFQRAGMRLDFGGIAKGYAADEALQTLRSLGLSQALVDGSGDIAIGDPPPGQSGWRVEVAPLRSDPSATPVQLLLANCAVATSGDAFQFVEIAGRRYSHIVDPRTGLGVTGASSVTVIAPTGMQADALASAVSVLGAEAGIRFVNSKPCAGVEALVVSVRADDRERVEQRESRGFRQFELKAR